MLCNDCLCTLVGIGDESSSIGSVVKFIDLQVVAIFIYLH